MGQKQSVPAADLSSTATSSGDQQPSSQSKSNPALQLQQPDSKAIAAMVESRSNPSEADAALHNYGQPIPPRHSPPSSTTNKGDETKSGASKLVTDCRVQQRASLACIEENYQNKNVACASYFEDYKNCRREEHERKLEANARASAW